MKVEVLSSPYQAVEIGSVGTIILEKGKWSREHRYRVVFEGGESWTFWPHELKVLGSHRVSTKIGRNDPCPCGVGRKFKKCHGRAA